MRNKQQKIVEIPSVTTAVNLWLEWQESVGLSRNTQEGRTIALNKFIRQFDCARHGVDWITEKEVNKFVNQDGDIRLNTRKNWHTICRMFLKFCAAKGWIQGNPADLVKVRMDKMSHKQKEKFERNPFTDEEVARLRAFCKRQINEADCNEDVCYWTFYYVVVTLGRHLGLRIGDICQLEWDTLEKPGWISVWTEKRDKRVSMPLPEEAAEALAYVVPQGGKYMFPQEAEDIRNPDRRSFISQRFGRICKRLGIHGKSAHDLRSSFIRARLKGQSIEEVAELVGHSDTRTTEGYLGAPN